MKQDSREHLDRAEELLRAAEDLNELGYPADSPATALSGGETLEHERSEDGRPKTGTDPGSPSPSGRLLPG